MLQGYRTKSYIKFRVWINKNEEVKYLALKIKLAKTVYD